MPRCVLSLDNLPRDDGVPNEGQPIWIGPEKDATAVAEALVSDDALLALLGTPPEICRDTNHDDSPDVHQRCESEIAARLERDSPSEEEPIREQALYAASKLAAEVAAALDDEDAADNHEELVNEDETSLHMHFVRLRQLCEEIATRVEEPQEDWKVSKYRRPD